MVCLIRPKLFFSHPYLPGEVFLDGNSTDDVATAWMEKYNDNKVDAVCDLVNFVLKCTGCDLEVDANDIEDPDNATNKLTDLQDEYQAKKIVDYPLLSRAKGNSFSRTAMVDFFHSLIETAHASTVLYSDPPLMENIQVWVTTMSSSSIRPFRHTATVISLAIASALCSNLKELDNIAATTVRQKAGEEKKKTVNKARAGTLGRKIQETEERKELSQGWSTEYFDAVFVHRYRDVDPKIRCDCISALGEWIATCPDIFFEGSYLRYLGWLLSDPAASVRGEVIKQLLGLYNYSDNLGRLRGFTERFRPRMVEMATRDADSAIRALAIDLLDMIRNLGLIEPDDIDVVGKLIFDVDPKVRKAVAPFFAATVNDALEAIVDEMGGEETMEEILGDETDEDHDNPRRCWLKFKFVAEMLDSYDTGDSEDGTPVPGMENLIISGTVESRYTMAARVVCEGIKEFKEWETLAGYLLYDNSNVPKPGRTEDSLDTFKQRCQLSEKEERLLLEILGVAVKLRLTQAIDSETNKKGKSMKARKDESRVIQETTALHLAKVIPLLLRRFGGTPSTASTILRLGHVLDLEIFQELRQDSTELDSLLDDINKQFLTHADRSVLTEASTALLNASAFEDLEDVTDNKVKELWEKTVASLRQTMRARSPNLTHLTNSLNRISRLASIFDCTEIFDSEPRSTPKAKAEPSSTILDTLLDLNRNYASEDSAETNAILTSSMSSLLCYYMWKARSVQEKLEANEPVSSVPEYDTFAATLTAVMEARAKLDEARLTAISILLDLHTLFATLRHFQITDEGTATSISNLIRDVTPEGQRLILSSFVAAERVYARKARRALEEAAEDDLPDDPVSESDDSSEDEDEDEDVQVRRAQFRQQELLLAEKRLCEITGKLVLAIVGRILDNMGPTKGDVRKRITRNKSKLGVNFKEVLNYLDEPKPKRSHKAKSKAMGKDAEKAKPVEKSNEMVDLEDDDDIEEVEEVEEGGEEDLRRKELQDGLEDVVVSEERVVENPIEEEDEIMGD